MLNAVLKQNKTTPNCDYLGHSLSLVSRAFPLIADCKVQPKLFVDWVAYEVTPLQIPLCSLRAELTLQLFLQPWCTWGLLS